MDEQPIKKNGGARPGSGRKPKSEQFKLPIARAEKQIADKLPHLIGKMLELADGVLIKDILPNGSPIIYQKPPDYKALAYLVDRIMGKPTERKEHTFPDKPLEEMSEDELRAIAEA